MTKMRVVILTNKQGNQIALANKISKHFEIAAIVFSRNIPKKRKNFALNAHLLVNRLANRTIGSKFLKAWFELGKHYQKFYPNVPQTETAEVTNVNDGKTYEIIKKYSPDLVIVSGTNLVGKRIIEISQKGMGIVNLHTGISPYVKGGPNCTNWCLAKNWFHLIGNTVMWLDSGIDTGNIIATEQTNLDGSETLFDLHFKVMEHAHSLLVRSLLKIAPNSEVLSVPQSGVSEGTLFYSVDWNAKAMRQALENFRRNYAEYFADSMKHEKLTEPLKLFPLD